MKHLIKISLFIFLFLQNLNANEIQNNIWLKTYQNYKNYNTIISNITKTESKIKQNPHNLKLQERLSKKLTIYKSKLPLYEKNNSFDNILIKYKYESPDITLREFILRNALDKLEKRLEKYQKSKNQFYLAKSTIQDNYNSLYKKIKMIKNFHH